jgi:iron complex outermembrane recepter protein
VFSQGFIAKNKIDTIGSEWVTDLSYTYQNNQNRQDFSLLPILPSSPFQVDGLGDITNYRHFFAGATDLKYKFPRDFTFETGIKTSIQRFSNTTDYEAIINGVSTPDPFRTNSYTYREEIHAAYLQGSKTLAGFTLKTGLRFENTNMVGRQTIPGDTTFEIRRSDLFPYVYLSRPIMKIAGYDLRAYLVYRRSIKRPVYEYLNPFPKFLDQYLYEAGNPGLLPQFTENYEFNISFDDYPVFALGRNYTQDIFTNVIFQDPNVPGVAYRTYANLGKNKETYFRVVGALPPGGKYFFVAGAQYNYNEYDGIYENKPLTFKRGSWSFFTYHQLKLDDLSTLSMNGFLRLKGQLQFYELSDFGNLNININRWFFKKKLLVTLSANDVLYTNRNSFFINQGNILANGERSADTRRFGVNLRYNFGLKKQKEENNMFNIGQPQE